MPVAHAERLGCSLGAHAVDVADDYVPERGAAVRHRQQWGGQEVLSVGFGRLLRNQAERIVEKYRSPPNAVAA